MSAAAVPSARGLFSTCAGVGAAARGGTINISRRCRGALLALPLPEFSTRPVHLTTTTPRGTTRTGALPNVLTHADGNRRVITENFGDGFFRSFSLFLLSVFLLFSHSFFPFFLSSYFLPGRNSRDLFPTALCQLQLYQSLYVHLHNNRHPNGIYS